MLNPVSFRYFKTSPEIIQLAVMLYVRFPLSLRNVEDLLHLSEPWKRQKVSIRSVQLKVILGLVFSPVWWSDVVCVVCVGDLENFSTRFSVGTFPFGLHNLHYLHPFFFLREGGDNININLLVDTQRAASLQETETVKLTVLTYKSQVIAKILTDWPSQENNSCCFHDPPRPPLTQLSQG